MTKLTSVVCCCCDGFSDSSTAWWYGFVLVTTEAHLVLQAKLRTKCKQNNGSCSLQIISVMLIMFERDSFQYAKKVERR